MDTGVQFRFNDDLFCTIDKVEKSGKEKIMQEKRQNMRIQHAVVKNIKIGEVPNDENKKEVRGNIEVQNPVGVLQNYSK